jgi:glyoxylase-like metal-dependent hydrolase (beta-lactamase superfamily II)
MSRLRVALLSLFVTLTGAQAAPLRTEVFTAGPAGVFVTSTLISGEKDAVLIDAQFSLSEAHRLAAKILESKKTLKTIFISHGHPDHYFGVEVLKAAFPQAQVLATPEVIAEMKATATQKMAQWKPVYGGNLTSAPVFPKPFKGSHLELEGERIELIPLNQGESEASTAVWIPSARTLVAGDAAYQDVHVWLAEADAARRESWLRNLTKLQALQPATVIAGHQVPGETAQARSATAALDATAAYIRDFALARTESKNAAELVQKMSTKYPGYQLSIVLDIAAQASFAAAK